MIYSLPYIIFICIFCFLSFLFHSVKTDEAKKYIVLVCVGIIIFFFGFRGFCFYDWNSYYPAFLHYSFYDLHSLPISDWPFEPGFSILMCLCKSLFDNYNFFVLICTTLNTVLLMRFLLNNVDIISFSFMIVFSMNGLGFFTDLMRNSISMLIFLNAIEFIEKRRALPYFALCLLALTFHTSTIFYFPLYFFLHKSINKWILLGVFITGNVVYLLHIPVFLTIVKLFVGLISPELQYKIDVYMELDPGASFQIGIGYLERLLTGILLFCYIVKLRDIRSDGNIYINGLILYFAMFFFLSEFKVISQRLSYLFSFGYWIIWYDLVKCFVIENNRKLFISFVCLYCMLKMYGSTHYVIAKYDNILFGSQPYHIRESIYNKNYSEIEQ